jgi:predicted nucleotidyltransferase
VIATRHDALRLVREFRDRLAEVYGDRLKGVYLYGSYARGDAREDSDVGVAVVLEGPVSAWEEDRRTSEITTELSLQHDCLLMPFFISEADYEEAPYAMHRNIVREGVPV